VYKKQTNEMSVLRKEDYRETMGKQCLGCVANWVCTYVTPTYNASSLEVG